MTDINELKSWISYAEEDYSAARALLKHAKPKLFSACFHAQQCAEKYLKAMLLLKDVDFPKTHDLISLNMLCNQAGIFTGFNPHDLVELSRHAVETRYPGNQPTLEEAREAVKIANVIRKFARKWLGLK
ncbi:MAG: HEPN domain-containing protein [Chloroflexota bacterium]